MQRTMMPAALAVRFSKLDDHAYVPEVAHEGDAGADLRALKGCKIAPGDRHAVPTGLAVEIPPGWAGLVLPRSGLARRHGVGLVNAPGLIDSGYRGELQVLLQNHDREAPVNIEAGDRIAQLVLVPFAVVAWVEAESLDATSRADGGFGSTGR